MLSDNIIEESGDRMTVITFSNFKGGTGKTTNCVMTAHMLAQKGKKVLVIDKDPQANATTLLVRTYANLHGEKPHIERFLLDGLEQGTFKDCIQPITDHLHLIPTTPAFSYYGDFLEEEIPGAKKNKYEERIAYFKRVLQTVKDDYDFVFIDVPPTISVYTDAALYASDYALIVLQTQDYSLDGADVFADYMVKLVDKYNLDLDVIGVLCVIFNSRSQIDSKVVQDAIDLFGEEHIFKTHIKHMERVKRYSAEGINDLDHHDKNVLGVYGQLANELMERVGVTV